MFDLTVVQGQLNQIKSIINSIEKQIRSDLNQDHLRSDQIKDQSQDAISACAHEGTAKCSEYDAFRVLCQENGISCDNLNLDSISRSIYWVVSNQSKILSMRNYLSKVVASAEVKPVKKVGFEVSQVDPEPVDTSIMGIDVVRVDEMRPYLDERTYLQVRESIPGYKTLFPNFDAVEGNLMKSRVVTAYAIKAGVL